MTVLLVILTFATFLVIDYFLSQKRAAKQPLLYTVVREARPVSPVVAGFEVPANLRYHPGHTWALSESPDRVRVGMDDFAGKLIGKVERIGLAERGRWI